MPPISPPPGAIGAGGVGISVTMLSVVNKVAATEAAFCNTERVTLVGSMIPHSTISQYLLFNASKPKLAFFEQSTLSTITEPSSPAFFAICQMVSSKAVDTIAAPVFSSPFKLATTFLTVGIAERRALPPPGT